MDVSINGLDFSIEEVRDVGLSEFGRSPEHQCFGLCNYMEQTISLDIGLTDAVKRRTLRHELVHAFMYAYGFSQIDTFTEEVICEFFGVYGGEIERIISLYFSEAEEKG